MRRLYLPLTPTDLAALHESKEFVMPDDVIVAADDSEDAEYAALCDAAAVAAGLLRGPGYRVVVVVAEPSNGVPIGWAHVAAIHADTAAIDPADEDLPDLGWFGVQEIGAILTRVQE